MNTMLRKSSSVFAALVSLFLGVALLAPNVAQAANPWGADYFPNLEFTTQDGKTVKLWDDLLKDKKVIVNFIYTECGASCPLETAKLAQVQKLMGDRMGKDIFFYSFTLDPKRDTPAVLSAYAKRYHAGPGWYFLTGKKADIEVVRKKLGQTTGNDKDLSDHKTSLMMGNVATGQWIVDSSMDDPHYIAAIAGDWLSSWKGPKPGQYYNAHEQMKVASGGAYLFKTRCSACHTVGDGDLVGPDLKHVATVRDREWLTKFVSAPDKMLVSDPVAKALFKKYNGVRMPNLRLSGADVEMIIKYLEAESVAPAATAAKPGAAETTGGLK